MANNTQTTKRTSREQQQCPACESTNVHEIITGSRFYREYHCRACDNWYFIEQPAPTTKRQRTSREQQRNAKAQAAYEGTIALGSMPGNPMQERFAVPSQSEQGASYLVTHNIVSDRYHCECAWSQNGHSGCTHELAAQRRVDERRADEKARAKAVATLAGIIHEHTTDDVIAEQAARDVAPLRRSNKPFSILA